MLSSSYSSFLFFLFQIFPRIFYKTNRNHHNNNWQYESNDKHRHKYASRQEDFLPDLAHSRQNLAIYHRVVEAKRNFQNHQNSK